MATVAWDLAQPVASVPFYAFARSPIIVWQSVGASGAPTFGELSGSATSTSQLTATLSALGELAGSAQSTSFASASLSDANFVPADIIPNTALYGNWDVNANLAGRWDINADLAGRKPS